jgi:hypothetical protein
MGKETVTETHFGNTLIIVTAECSPTATETIEKKLERLIVRHFSDMKPYQDDGENRVAMYSNQSEYGSDPI